MLESSQTKQIYCQYYSKKVSFHRWTERSNVFQKLLMRDSPYCQGPSLLKIADLFKHNLEGKSKKNLHFQCKHHQLKHSLIPYSQSLNTFPCRSRWELCCGRLHYREEEPMHISFTLIHLEVERKQEIWCAWSANHPSSHKGGALCACPRLFTRALRVHTWNMFGCKVLRRVSTYGKLSWSRAVKRITSLNHAHINRLVSVVCSLTITEASARAELARTKCKLPALHAVVLIVAQHHYWSKRRGWNGTGSNVVAHLCGHQRERFLACLQSDKYQVGLPLPLVWPYSSSQ